MSSFFLASLDPYSSFFNFLKMYTIIYYSIFAAIMIIWRRIISVMLLPKCFATIKLIGKKCVAHKC